MLRVALAAIVVSGCAAEMATTEQPFTCTIYHATILAPTKGAVVPRALETRVLWGDLDDQWWEIVYDDDDPNLFINMVDYPGQVQSDGSIVVHWDTLPANSHFRLDVGRFCISNVQPDQYEWIPAAGESQFTTGAN